MAFGTVFRNFSSAIRASGFIFRDGRRMLGVRVINKTGSAIAANKLVALSGYDVTSKLMKIVLADADSANLATEIFVTRTAIANGATSHVYRGFTSTANLDTSGATTVGDPLFLSTTAGAFTSTAPTTAGSRVVIVGYSMVKSNTIGQVAWDVQQPSVLGTLDVQAGTGLSSGLITYTGDGAISIAPQIALLTKGSAAAMTVAAPGAAGVGVRITITSGSNFAHVITFTGGTLGDGTTGLNTTVTMTAFIGSSITVIGNTATQWVVESQNVLTSIA